MIDKLSYYYRVVHLQVGSTYIVALALLAFVIEIVIFLATSGGKPASGREDRTEYDDNKRFLILQTVLWLATLSPMGMVIAKIFLGGEPNNPILFACIPAAACTAYGVITVYRCRRKISTLVLAAVLILIAAGQVSGFTRPSLTMDRYSRETEIADIEAAIDGYMGASDEKMIIAPYDIASRLCEYRDDMRIYLYDDIVDEPRQMNSGPAAIEMGADVLICPAADAAENIQYYLYGCEYLTQTEHYAVMKVPKE